MTGTIRGSSSHQGGFTLLEILIVVTVVMITLALTGQMYGNYMERTSGRRAAQIFARDLSLARSSAVRGRESVVVRFDETAREYEVETASGTRLIHRSFGTDAEVRLGSIDLDMPGDSLVFNARGIADLSGIAGPLGEAVFAVGGTSFTVSFNALGASRVSET